MSSESGVSSAILESLPGPDWYTRRDGFLGEDEEEEEKDDDEIGDAATVFPL